ncbi:MAG: DNA repair protein RecN [Alphaproteobacteria bacterium]|nr:DNA repair protein RecN [Alphaproteobacteria bacterium]
MLTTLSIQNVVLIESLNIEFSEGLCALTGETGAGKSILLDSLGLALGARSESGLVRKGADKASVIASFDIPKNHPAIKIMKEAELEPAQEIILRRSVGADGRSKAFINDQPVSVGLLRQIGDSLVEIHGQFDTHGLLDPSTHRDLLDEYAGIGGSVAAQWGEWRAKEKALAALRSSADKARADEDFLRQAIEDLDALGPKEGEEQELADLRERLMNREQVLEGLSVAYNVLNGEDDPVRSAWGTLDRISSKLGGQGAQIIETLSRASSEMQEASALIEALSADLQETEHSLETIDERLFTLRAQARKHSCTVDDLPRVREELAQQLGMIEHGDEVLAQAIKAAEKAKNSYVQEAQKVSKIRHETAQKLDKLVQAELPPLKLDKATFTTSITMLDEDDWGPGGCDKVQFLVATNPGADAGPLNKIASGGELSRFTLALKVVMAEVGAAGSLIFDEVDAGIGGSTADAVGERLVRLASNKQILVVTHAPQVAARATHHYIVHKDGAEKVTTSVSQLASRADRCEEIARMLAGATITQEARAAADKLLETGKAA